METDTRSLQDALLSVLESIVSIHHWGDWTADINIVAVAHTHQVFLMPLQPCSRPETTTPDFPMLSISSWDEILDLPKDINVILANGNWAARLAIVAFLVEHWKDKVQRIVICPFKVCWKCVKLQKRLSGTCTVYAY